MAARAARAAAAFAAFGQRVAADQHETQETDDDQTWGNAGEKHFECLPVRRPILFSRRTYLNRMRAASPGMGAPHWSRAQSQRTPARRRCLERVYLPELLTGMPCAGLLASK